MLNFTQRAAPLAALAIIFGASLAIPVTAQDSASSSATASKSAAPGPAGDADFVAQGKQVWSDAACYNCHGRYIPRPKDSLYKHGVEGAVPPK